MPTTVRLCRGIYPLHPHLRRRSAQRRSAVDPLDRLRDARQLHHLRKSDSSTVTKHMRLVMTQSNKRWMRSTSTVATDQSIRANKSSTSDTQKMLAVCTAMGALAVATTVCGNKEGDGSSYLLGSVAHAEEATPTTSPTTTKKKMMMMKKKGLEKFTSTTAIEDEYEITDEIIGEGGYCVVRKALDRKTGEAVAVKMLSKAETSAREFWTEVDVLRTAGKHPNIMKLCNVYETEDSWYIVQDLASDGELFDHLVANGAYSEKQASEAVRQLCDALHYLHRKGIVHGDIKPENILLHQGRMCLVDFGVSFRVGERFFGESQLTGTVAYAAPETLRQSNNSSDYQPYVHEGIEMEYHPQKFGPKADMFALGIVLYILLCGSHPFDPYNNLSDDEIRQRIIKGKFRTQCQAWKQISPVARDLIQRLLEVDPEKRLSSKEALEHPWLCKTAQLSLTPMPESAELLQKFQRGRRRLRASILGVLLLDALEDDADVTDDIDTLVKTRKDIAWGISSRGEALGEKAKALMLTLDKFDKDRKGFITKNDLARVSEKLGKRMSDNELNEMLVGATGDPEKKPSSVESIGYDNVKMAISTLRSVSYDPGEAIIREGNIGGSNVYLILDGEVEVSCKNPIVREEDERVFGSFLSNFAQSDREAEEIVLKHLQKGSFFGEIELMRPDGQLHPRIATYRCASNSGTPCKVLQLFADDFLNVSGTYSSLNERLVSSVRNHTQEQLIKCVEAAKGAVKKRAFKPGEFVYREGEVCDSFFILLDGEVEVLKQNGEVVVEELHPGDCFPLGVSGQTLRSKMITRHSTVRCKEPTHVLEIGGETFRSFLSSNQFMASYFREEVKSREKLRSDRMKPNKA